MDTKTSDKKYILLVEDDPSLQKACKFKFETKGIDLRVIGDGQEMKDFIKQNTKDLPAVVVLDLILPRVGGIEILNEMHNTEEWKDIPVVILTNITQIIDLEHLRQLGVKDYLIKTDITLDKAVDKILSYYNNE